MFAEGPLEWNLTETELHCTSHFAYLEWGLSLLGNIWEVALERPGIKSSLNEVQLK